ncbi:probable palmitoyltransferase ZDHHC24 [Daktulosphaira vitifoliae]|uniref:probable palmitoyltransferase ZDHHC24 n=1 Tax=Daktulosphaira vitifoliae TaxID=58002 RepID=UPI0021AA38AE|nr:probable palmitoyltransferase ZDHHC24 [Daktulosphaira vitifoliae]
MLLKKKTMEVFLFLFFTTSIIIYYCLNVFCIFPDLYKSYVSFDCIIHVLITTYGLFNILTNFIVMTFVDSSVIEHRTRKLEKIKTDSIYCNICQCTMPPRSWHCDECNVCILTRDHHCSFSTTCIGHYNRRYFVWFLAYLTVGSIYEIVLIGYYIYKNIPIQIFDLIFLAPGNVIFFKITKSQVFVSLFMLNLISVVISSLLLKYHIEKLLYGLLSYEKKKNYDYGLIVNLKIVFGERWFITWISPFIDSSLPNDGFTWKILGCHDKVH